MASYGNLEGITRNNPSEPYAKCTNFLADNIYQKKKSGLPQNKTFENWEKTDKGPNQKG